MTATEIVAALVSVAVLTWPGGAGRRAAWFALHRPTATEPGVGSGQTTSAAPDDGHSPSPRPAGRPRSRLYRSRRAGHPRRSETLQLLDRLAAGLASGLVPADALDAAGAQLPEAARLLGPVVRATGEGRSPAAALGRVARVTGDEDLARVARAWALSEGTGCSLADAVASAVRAGRSHLEHHRQVRAATAGARATVALLSLLPLGGAAVGVLLGVPPDRLYASPVAVASAAVGVLMVLLGRAVVSRMIKRVEAL